MSLTNLVVLSSTLLTAHQQAVTGRTNGQAIISHVEQVKRVQVTAEKTRFHKPKNFATNVTLVSERRWQEAMQDLTPAVPIEKPLTNTLSKANADAVIKGPKSVARPVATSTNQLAHPNLPPNHPRNRKPGASK